MGNSTKIEKQKINSTKCWKTLQKFKKWKKNSTKGWTNLQKWKNKLKTLQNDKQL